MFQKDILRDYINDSEIRYYSDTLRVRLSNELAKKYDNGVYNNYLENLQKDFDLVKSLGIILPGGANPIFYLYIVPDENFEGYLKIPPAFSGNRRGGKPVNCYDNDGFNSAYGISQNIAEEFSFNMSIDVKENNIHEIAHIFQHQFFSGNQVIGEGFAETIPLYGLELEDVFEKHKSLLSNIDESHIKSAKELIDESRNGNYGNKELINNSTCSFRESYLSSYLLVRGIIDTIIQLKKISREEAIQDFLELIKSAPYNGEYLIYEIANYINIPMEELLYEKSLQLKEKNKIIEKENLIVK